MDQARAVVPSMMSVAMAIVVWHVTAGRRPCLGCICGRGHSGDVVVSPSSCCSKVGATVMVTEVVQPVDMLLGLAS
jgi:hypothetical protein